MTKMASLNQELQKASVNFGSVRSSTALLNLASLKNQEAIINLTEHTYTFMLHLIFNKHLKVLSRSLTVGLLDFQDFHFWVKHDPIVSTKIISIRQ